MATGYKSNVRPSNALLSVFAAKGLVSVIQLAVHEGLHVQGVYVLEGLLPKSEKYLVIQITPDGFRVFPATQHLFLVVPFRKFSVGYFQMQKVRIRPNPCVYWGSSDYAPCWRLAGDLKLPTCPTDRVHAT